MSAGIVKMAGDMLIATVDDVKVRRMSNLPGREEKGNGNLGREWRIRVSKNPKKKENLNPIASSA